MNKVTRFINPKNREHVLFLMMQLLDAGLLEHDEVVIELREKTRSDEQNACLHAMIGDVAEQLPYQGEWLKPQQWKPLFVSGHAVATDLPHQVVTGLEGEWVNIRESTAKMSIKRCASLITYVEAYGVESGVQFRGVY